MAIICSGRGCNDSNSKHHSIIDSNSNGFSKFDSDNGNMVMALLLVAALAMIAALVCNESNTNVVTVYCL